MIFKILIDSSVKLDFNHMNGGNYRSPSIELVEDL